MSQVQSGRRLRHAWAVLLATVLVCTGLPVTSVASPAAPSLQSRDGMDAGVYVVVLRDAPLATHPGTRPGVGERVDTTSEAATTYAQELLRQQASVLEQVAAEPTYHYTTVLNGFAVQLTAAEATALSRRPDVLSLTPDEPRQLLGSHEVTALAQPPVPATDVSPDLLGLRGVGGVWQQLGGVDQAGRGVVVGVLDTGLAWSNPSFSATGISPKPVGFTGACDSGQDPVRWPQRACTNKVVSGRYFIQGLLANGATPSSSESVSPFDVDSHGSHVSGTAVGRQTTATTPFGTSVTIAGMAPAAHLATYKVCWRASRFSESGCYPQDSIAAIDRAVRDGVDVLNFSVSGNPDTYRDPVDLAFKNAAAAGVFVAAAAGNGNDSGVPVAHTGPWMTTVAASVHRTQDGPVPSIASFSGRGPVAVLPQSHRTILKPDLGAPGVNVLAPVAGTTSSWDYLTGTSMASPHVAGLAALQAQAHPTWSPMAIKSSLMTSARGYATSGSNNPFAGGAGFVRPPSMLGTPLVFDSRVADWDAFLADPTRGTALNTASVQVPQLPAAAVTVTRTITNVTGSARTFTASSTGPGTLPVHVEPETLSVPAGGSAQVRIRFANTGAPTTSWQTAWVTWKSTGVVPVRIPVVARGQVFAPKVGRLGGLNRYDTARLISTQFPAGTDTVYLASGLSFADALAASPAAARGQVPSTLTSSGAPAPLLLIGDRGIPPETRAALDALTPRSIVILGGTTAISGAIQEQLRNEGYAVARVAGEDRYDTAAKVARLSGSDVPLVYVASGADPSYPDALSGASAAARDGAPVLLTRPDRVPDSVTDALGQLRPARIVVLGGERAVQDTVFRQLGADARLGGANRYETAALVAATFRTDPARSYIAQGRNWPDALAGSVLAGSQKAPVLITEAGSIPGVIAAELDRLSPQRLSILGGTNAVSTTVEDTLNVDYPRWVVD